MSEGGYTAADALSALAIVGLAMGGLTTGLHVMGQTERAVATSVTTGVEMRQARAALERLVGEGGPFRSDTVDGFEGDSAAFSFPCGATRCSAETTATGVRILTPESAQVVALRSKGPLEFSYVGGEGPSPVWPPAPLSPPAPSWQPLQAIIVRDGELNRPLASVRIHVTQAADCDFDVVTQDCRS